MHLVMLLLFNEGSLVLLDFEHSAYGLGRWPRIVMQFSLHYGMYVTYNQ